MENVWRWGNSQRVLTVAGRSGASGRPVPGRVGVGSRAPTETVITRCKSHYSLKGYGVFISTFCIEPERRRHPVTHRTRSKVNTFSTQVSRTLVAAVDAQCETNHLIILNYMAQSAYRTKFPPEMNHMTSITLNFSVSNYIATVYNISKLQSLLSSSLIHTL